MGPPEEGKAMTRLSLKCLTFAAAAAVLLAVPDDARAQGELTLYCRPQNE